MAKLKILTKKQLDKEVKKIDQDWKLASDDKKLSRIIEFTNPVEALSFIAKVVVHAEVAQHHPEIHLTYSKVKLSLTTHEVKGLTKRDVDLAKRIDTLCS